MVETHLALSSTPRLWAGIGLCCQNGGETTIDAIIGNNRINQPGGGVHQFTRCFSRHDERNPNTRLK